MLNYKNVVVTKPWGFEYLVYENTDVALWYLCLNAGASTSLHCHPSKTTGLVVLNGSAKISFLNNETYIGSTEKIMIRKGLFHSTTALNNKLHLFEIETPVNKHDIVRLTDSYGRATEPYEGVDKQTIKDTSCLWIVEPPLGASIVRYFNGCVLTIMNIANNQILNDLDDNENIIFLNGGIITNYNCFVASPGDIINGKTIKRLFTAFPKLHDNTIIMRITSDFNNYA